MILSVCPNLSVDKFLNLTTLKLGEINRSLGEQSYPGGKGSHVALAVSELGYASTLASIWGGPTGKWVRNECQKYNVDCLGPHTEKWTRTCLTILSGSDNIKTEILEQGPDVSERVLNELLLTINTQLREADALCISGSWPLGAPSNIYQKLKKLSDHSKTPLWVDASENRLKQAIQIKPFGIHINKKEAEFLFGKGKDCQKYVKELLQYCSMAAVTDGADGLFLANNQQIVHAICPVDNVISTVGSGDCLLAGLVIGVLEGLSFEKIAKLGVACGAANCIRPELGLLYRNDVSKLIKIATINELTVHE